MNKKNIRDLTFNYLEEFGDEIRTKFDNICGKTGQYNVPFELFQKRTHRKNRSLISWRTVKENNISLQQLESFSGGIVIEFLNNDYFNDENLRNPLFNELKSRLGGDKTVASMISIRTEEGSSSSSIQRESFQKLLKSFPNYKDNIIRRRNDIQYTGIGNEKWKGYIYVSIRGGQQDTITTHNENVSYQLFNPACEYANENICLDIDLVMAYFALKSIKTEYLNEAEKEQQKLVMEKVEYCLENCEYNNPSFTGNLLHYCQNHPSLKMKKDKLYDPIQVEEIFIEDFSIVNKSDRRNLDLAHNEAVNKGKYYWDSKQNCILSPARPTNMFWSKHLSNMMQQNFSLEEYFIHEEEIVHRRKELLEQ